MKTYKKIMLFCGITLLVVLSVSFILNRIFSEKPPVINPQSDIDEKIYDSLRIPGYENSKFVLSEITLENAREALKKINMQEDYYWLNTVSRFNDNKFIKNKNEIWKSGDCYRVEINGDVKKTIVHDGDRTLITNPTRKTSKIIEGDVDFSYSNQIGVADIEYFLRDTQNILTQTKLIHGEYGNIIYIEFMYQDVNQREEFYISTDYGIVLSARTYIDDALSYELSTNEFIPNYSSDIYLFETD